MQYAAVVSRWAVAFIFAAAVYGKCGRRGRFAAFRRSIRDMFPFVGRAAAGMSAALVAAEAAVVLLLAIPLTVPVGLGLAGTILIVFCAGITLAIRSGTGGECLCFGSSPAPLGVRHLVRNAFVLVVVAAGLAGLNLAGRGDLEPGAVVLAAAGAAVLALITISFDDLAELFIVRETPARGGR